MSTTQVKRPDWYTAEDDTAWGRVKAAFQRDWQQTEYDFGGKVSNLNQQVGDTVGQATGSKPIPPTNMPTPHAPKGTTYQDEDEPDYRYGYSAYRHYHPASEMNLEPSWDTDELAMRQEWGNETEWERRRDAIRRGWSYGELERKGVTPK